MAISNVLKQYATGAPSAMGPDPGADLYTKNDAIIASLYSKLEVPQAALVHLTVAAPVHTMWTPLQGAGPV